MSAKSSPEFNWASKSDGSPFKGKKKFLFLLSFNNNATSFFFSTSLTFLRDLYLLVMCRHTPVTTTNPTSIYPLDYGSPFLFQRMTTILSFSQNCVFILLDTNFYYKSQVSNFIGTTLVTKKDIYRLLIFSCF